MTATLAPTLTARERRARLTARLKTLEAQSNEAIMYGDMAAWRDADEAWHRILGEWMAAADDMEAERGR
jgi:hypothetical protein